MEMFSITAQQYSTFAGGILIEQLKTLLHKMIRDRSDCGHIASGYLLWLVGQTLFCDKTTNKIKLRYLHALMDHDCTSRNCMGCYGISVLIPPSGHGFSP